MKQYLDFFAPDSLARFCKFCCVGVGNFLVDFGVYFFLSSFVMPVYPARALSWMAACLFSYLVNRSWTFRSKDRGALPLLRFALVNVCSLLLGLGLLHLFMGAGCGHVSAFLLSLPFTIASNYLGYRFWSFRHIG